MDKLPSHQESHGDLRPPDNFLDGKAIPMLLQNQESLTDLAPIKASPSALSQPSSQSSDKAPPPLPTHSEASIMNPEPASLNAILRDHCRTRLYVRPLVWTMDQPRLLGCCFVHKKLPCKLRKRRALDETTDEQKATREEPTAIQQERSRQAELVRRLGVLSYGKSPLEYLLETFSICISE